MRNTACSIPTYASDTSGVCSALYELGGMTVVHDSSGCNSTYSTFDEPRWYDRESLIFITGLTEAEAIFGREDRLLDDVAAAAAEFSPAFIALCGSPMPFILGTDYAALAGELEERCGLPVLGLPTTGIRTYLSGADLAWTALLQRFCDDVRPASAVTINILGATPLDLGLNGSVDSMKAFFEGRGITVNACLAMGGSLAELRRLGAAAANLVVASSGIGPALYLKRRFGTPFVAGQPIGLFAEDVLAALVRAAESGTDMSPCSAHHGGEGDILVAGEAVAAASLACALERETGRACRVFCPLGRGGEALAAGDVLLDAEDEERAAELFAGAGAIVADPLYRPVCPKGTPFLPLGHVAFSGRCHLGTIPDMTARPLAEAFDLSFGKSHGGKA
ncbi:MAG: nitrogenase component 1 [Desulfovibrio sp.]|nr:nitrogenase component 1 [Desulfovibrio sp.]